MEDLNKLMIEQLRDACLAAEIPVVLDRGACCGAGGCGCAPKLELRARPEDLPRVFERFYRADKARSHEVAGTGLGLAIVKHLVEAQHGTVQVQSQPGHGATFTFTLPAA